LAKLRDQKKMGPQSAPTGNRANIEEVKKGNEKWHDKTLQEKGKQIPEIHS